MSEWYAGRTDELAGDRRKMVEVNGRPVVVFQRGGRFYALDGTCAHMGGPLGEGILIGKVETVLGEDREDLGERFSETQINLVCPWHGYEYNIETGRHAGNPKVGVRKYETLVRGDELYVVA